MITARRKTLAVKGTTEPRLAPSLTCRCLPHAGPARQRPLARSPQVKPSRAWSRPCMHHGLGQGRGQGQGQWAIPEWYLVLVV